MFVGFTNCKTCQRVIVPAFLPPFAFFMHSALTPYIKSNQIKSNQIKSNQQQWCLHPICLRAFLVTDQLAMSRVLLARQGRLL
jgi:hypothetical protein